MATHSYVKHGKNMAFFNSLHIQCGYCDSTDVSENTLTCNNCGTTSPNGRYNRKKRVSTRKGKEEAEHKSPNFMLEVEK